MGESRGRRGGGGGGRAGSSCCMLPTWLPNPWGPGVLPGGEPPAGLLAGLCAGLLLPGVLGGLAAGLVARLRAGLPVLGRAPAALSHAEGSTSPLRSPASVLGRGGAAPRRAAVAAAAFQLLIDTGAHSSCMGLRRKTASRSSTGQRASTAHLFRVRHTSTTSTSCISLAGGGPVGTGGGAAGSPFKSLRSSSCSFRRASQPSAR